MKSNIIKSTIAVALAAGAIITTGVIAYNNGYVAGSEDGYAYGAAQLEAGFAEEVGCNNSDCLWEAIQSIAK